MGTLDNFGKERKRFSTCFICHQNIYPDHISFPVMDEMMKYHLKANADIASFRKYEIEKMLTQNI